METHEQNISSIEEHQTDFIADARKEEAKKGVFYLNEIFTQELMEYLVHGIKKADADKNIEEITLYINSNGGSVYALLPLIDVIDKCETPVSTIVLGKAFSCGAMLLMAGTKGHRKAHKHSFILLHEVSNWYEEGTRQTNTQTKNNSKHTDRLNKLLAKITADRTTMTKDEIKLYFETNQDLFIDAQEALDYGLVDEIIS